MWSHFARVTAAAVLAILPTLVPPTSTLAAAAGPGSLSVYSPAEQGGDPCPEPNDTFQSACYLGPSSDAQGFISRANDVDAYRIEVLDFNTEVHVEMPTMPAPYKIELANWNGDIIATSSGNGSGGEAIDTTVDVPGAYYIFIHSAGGGFNPNRPYQLFRALTYPGATIPSILFTSEFRQGSKEAVEADTEYATHAEDGGRYTISMKVSGAPDDPSEAWWTGFGPELTDFTMTVDTRINNNVPAGSTVFFRHVDNQNTYQVGLDSFNGAVQLWKIADGEVTGTGWTESSAIDTKGGVNRIVIRCFEDHIVINVNGEDLVNIRDGSFRKGRIGIGGIAYGDPPVLSFDNVIITTPTEG